MWHRAIVGLGSSGCGWTSREKSRANKPFRSSWLEHAARRLLTLSPPFFPLGCLLRIQSASCRMQQLPTKSSKQTNRKGGGETSTAWSHSWPVRSSDRMTRPYSISKPVAVVISIPCIVSMMHIGGADCLLATGRADDQQTRGCCRQRSIILPPVVSFVHTFLVLSHRPHLPAKKTVVTAPPSLLLLPPLLFSPPPPPSSFPLGITFRYIVKGTPPSFYRTRQLLTVITAVSLTLFHPSYSSTQYFIP